jgi:hypothetical protein
MRLVQRGAGAELQLLLGHGECNINAQAVNTGAAEYCGSTGIY